MCLLEERLSDKFKCVAMRTDSELMRNWNNVHVVVLLISSSAAATAGKFSGNASRICQAGNCGEPFQVKTPSVPRSRQYEKGTTDDFRKKALRGLGSASSRSGNTFYAIEEAKVSDNGTITLTKYYSYPLPFPTSFEENGKTKSFLDMSGKVQEENLKRKLPGIRTCSGICIL